MNALQGQKSKTAAVGLVSLALWACSGIPLSSYPKLMQLDPLAADPEDIRVAIRSSNAIDVTDVKVLMALSYKTEDGSFDEAHEFEVQATEAQFMTPALAKGAQPDDRTTILRLTTEDARTLYGFQKSVRGFEDSDIEGQGVLSLSANGWCLPAGIQQEDMNLTFFLQTEPDADFFVFMRQNINDWLEENESTPTTEAMRCQEAAGLQ